MTTDKTDKSPSKPRPIVWLPHDFAAWGSSERLNTEFKEYMAQYGPETRHANDDGKPDPDAES